MADTTFLAVLHERQIAPMKFWPALSLTMGSLLAAIAEPVWAINGGTLRVIPRNSWRAFEVISAGDNLSGYVVPDVFDGVGAWLPTSDTLRVAINHETSDASVSEVNLDLANFQSAIRNVITSNNTGGVGFVTSAQQAYSRWTANGGNTWTNTSSNTTTAFQRFCSGQSYVPDAFGPGRGFVDNIYITGEEVTGGRLFALDLANRDWYQLSGYTGAASGGLGGMPADAWENAALLDTGDTTHVALLLSPDGGSQIMQLYIGDKGKDTTGNTSNSFLARNGLAYGRYYYLNDTLPVIGAPSTNGFIDTTTGGALLSAKLEDVDANPNDPTQAVVGIQETGLFTLDFNLDFSGGNFNPGSSSFSVTKIRNQNNDTDNEFGDADNVDWTRATNLNGVNYPNGLVFVNEDSGTGNGETWMMTPSGSGLTLIADTYGSSATETSGVLDISALVGYKPGSILFTSNQGTSVGSLTVLINPNAALAGDFNDNGTVDAADYVIWRKTDSGNSQGYTDWQANYGEGMDAGGGSAGASRSPSAVPEPATLVLLMLTAAGWYLRRCRAAEQDRVALGRYRPRAPTDPYVRALAHTVPRITDSLRDRRPSRTP
jgi:hypothetical protein